MATAEEGRRRPFPRRPDHSEQRPHRNFASLLHDHPLQHPILEDLHVDRALVGVDRRDDVAAMHGIPRVLVPLGQRSGDHIRAERRHPELTHGTASQLLRR